MKRMIFTILLFQVLSSQAQTIPLKQAVEKGLLADPFTRISTLNAGTMKLKLKKAKRNRLFYVEGSAVYRYQSLVPELDMGSIMSGMAGYVPMTQKMGTFNNYDGSVKIVQPLYTGGVLSAAVRSSDAFFKSSLNISELARISKASEIKTSFYTYRYLIQKRISTRTLIAQLRLHLKRLNDLYKEGLSNRSDILETETKIEEILLKLDDVNRLIQDEALRFKSLCGFAPDQIDTTSVERAMKQEDALSFFNASHPMIKSFDYKINGLGALKKAAAGSYLPRVAGFFEAHYAKPGIDYFNDQWNSYFFAGVSVNVPIFNWNKRGIDIEIADIEVKKAVRQKEDFIRNQILNIKRLFNQKSSINQKLKRAEILLKKSGEQTELKKKLYSEGQISHLDYLRALEQEEKYRSLVHELAEELNICNVSINAAIGFTGEIK